VKFTRPISSRSRASSPILRADRQRPAPYKTLKELTDDAKETATRSSSVVGLYGACISDGALHEAAGGLKFRHLRPMAAAGRSPRFLGNNSHAGVVGVGLPGQIKAARPSARFVGANRSKRCRRADMKELG